MGAVSNLACSDTASPVSIATARFEGNNAIDVHIFLAKWTTNTKKIKGTRKIERSGDRRISSTGELCPMCITMPGTFSQLATTFSFHISFREGYFGTAILVCDGRLATIQDVPLAILKGVCLTLLGKIPEAIRQLEIFSSDNDYALGALHALKWAHTSAFNPDNKSIVEIETEISTRTRSDKTPYTSFASAAEVNAFDR